jgi:hypothetical protein
MLSGVKLGLANDDPHPLVNGRIRLTDPLSRVGLLPHFILFSLEQDFLTFVR